MLRRRVLLILLTVAVAVGFTIATADNTVRYTAQSTLYVGANTFAATGTFDPNLSADQQQGFARVIQTFAIMIRSAPIASAALETTGVPRSANRVVAETAAVPIKDTNILVIVVTDTDPAIAQALSIGLAEAFVAKITELEPGKAPAEGDLPTAPARIFERAKLPVAPQKESVLTNIIIAGLLGVMLSAGAVLLVEYLDVTVKSVEDAERRLELPVLGVVPQLALDPSTTLRRPPTGRRKEIGLVRDA
jgi:capsular polysaccharide biosynthesis protein